MKTLTGTVTSIKTAKTATVSVTTRWQHPMYKKIMKKTKKYLVHDDIGAKLDQEVTIAETKPISKRKRWIITDITNTEK